MVSRPPIQALQSPASLRLPLGYSFNGANWLQRIAPNERNSAMVLWRVAELLNHEKMTAYRLVQDVGTGSDRRLPDPKAGREVRRVGWQDAGHPLRTLRCQPGDLLEYVEDGAPAPEGLPRPVPPVTAFSAPQRRLCDSTPGFHLVAYSVQVCPLLQRYVSVRRPTVVWECRLKNCSVLIGREPRAY